MVVTVPLGATRLLSEVTEIVAAAVGPLSPETSAVDDDCTTKLPVAVEFAVGVNFSPADACASVRNSPL